MFHIAVIAGNIKELWNYAADNYPYCHIVSTPQWARIGEGKMLHLVDSWEAAYGFIFDEVVTIGTGHRLRDYDAIVIIASRRLGTECAENTSL